MAKRCLFAHTDPGGTYPPYLNVSETEDGQTIEITVRSAPGPSGPMTRDIREGATAIIKLPRADYDRMLLELRNAAA